MKNFFGYCLGVFIWLKEANAYAIEKFEVLPDLPEPLAACAIQPAQAATVSGTADLSTIGVQSVGNEPSIVSVILSLLFVILLIYFTGIIYTKLNKVGFKTLKRQQGSFSRSQVTVVSTTQLGNNKTLHVVELDGKRMLIGASSTSIQLIKDLGSIDSQTLSEEFSQIEIPNIKIPKIEIPTIKFSKLATRTHEPIKKVENPDFDKNEEKIAVETIPDEISSEEIIDSLFAQTQDALPESEVTSSKSEHIVDPDDFALYKKYLG